MIFFIKKDTIAQRNRFVNLVPWNKETHYKVTGGLDVTDMRNHGLTSELGGMWFQTRRVYEETLQMIAISKPANISKEEYSPNTWKDITQMKQFALSAMIMG